MGRRKKWTTRRVAQRGAPDGKDEDVIAQGECVQRARLLVPVPDLSFSVHRAAQHRAACTHGQKQRSTTGGRHITGVVSHVRRRKHGTRWEWHALGCATGCQAPAWVHAPSTLMRNAAASRNVKPFLLSVDRIGSTMLRSSTDPTAGQRGGTRQTVGEANNHAAGRPSFPVAAHAPAAGRTGAREGGAWGRAASASGRAKSAQSKDRRQGRWARTGRVCEEVTRAGQAGGEAQPRVRRVPGCMPRWAGVACLTTVTSTPAPLDSCFR